MTPRTRWVEGTANRAYVATRKPPQLRPGQRRCPVCRNGSRLTDSGHLRRHRDLFGHDCYNRAPASETP